MDKEKIIRAGKIAKEVKEFIKTIVKKDTPLLEIAEKIENKIIELGGFPAFPTNLSINEIAAHYTPSYNDETLAHGLLKVDFGVSVEGFIADTAISFDLEDSKENKELILASKNALDAATKKISKNSKISEIGKTIEEEIGKKGFNPVVNLTGHGLGEYDLHAGIQIPNYNNSSNEIFGKGLFAIEPFATNGNGKVHDGKDSGIYMIQKTNMPRSQIAREILNHAIEKYKTLPFCSRWLIKDFGPKAIIGIKQLVQNKNLHSYPQLVESTKGIVSQAENTILIEEDSTIITSD
jgi:methionyl aminopeptidase